LLKKTFGSKGRMNEKAERNCIMWGFKICTVPQILSGFRRGHGARILNKGWNILLYTILIILAFALTNKK